VYPLLENREQEAAPLQSRTDAAERLFREQNGALVAYLTSRLRSVQEANEVAQEALVRLLQQRRRTASSFKLVPVRSIAANCCLSFMASHWMASVRETLASARGRRLRGRQPPTR
jgi:DNA-directed RNA polymerase specialized sigma24 family protein